MVTSNNENYRVLLLSPYPKNIKDTIEDNGDKVFVFNKKIDPNLIKDNAIDFIVSFGYKYVLRKEVIEELKYSAFNLHISYLPYNRGYHPNVWSHFDQTLKGVTIHLIDEGIDTGNILFQKEVYINDNEHTFSSSYNLLITEIEKLFNINWCYLRTNQCKGSIQNKKGTFHLKKDIEKIKPYLKYGWDTKIKDAKLKYLKFINQNL